MTCNANIARNAIRVILAALAVGSAPVAAQKMGAGGTIIDGSQPLEKCATPLGTVSLVEEQKAATPDAILSPQMAAIMALARAQQGMSSATADPMPLLKILMTQSRCFRVVDRGAAFNALQREREIAQGQQITPGNGVAGSTLIASDYVLAVQVIYQDENAGGGGGGGGIGGGFGSALGIKTKRLESQVLMTLTAVRTGEQVAVASGSARKKDTRFIGGGLVGLGLGAVAGGYESTDIGKVTAAALLNAYDRLIPQVRVVIAPGGISPTAETSAPSMPPR